MLSLKKNFLKKGGTIAEFYYKSILGKKLIIAFCWRKNCKISVFKIKQFPLSLLRKYNFNIYFNLHILISTLAEGKSALWMKMYHFLEHEDI